MLSYLDGIVAWHRARASSDDRDIEKLADEARARRALIPARPFEGALRAARRRSGVAVIAEIKRRSPSRGDLDMALDPSSVAREYAAGGAACLSVLTDAPHFGGSPGDLVAARAAVGLPVLRKDFTVSTRDIYDAAIMGADAVLLIAAVLSDDELGQYVAEAATLDMAALVEVHDEQEAARALAASARLVGVNQRDLHSFEVDSERAARVVAVLPPEVLRVAESGIHDASQVSRLAAAGFDAVLIGETLVLAPDRVAAVRSLAGVSGSVAC